MAREYYVAARNLALATASGDYDLIYLAAATEKPIKLMGFILGQTSEVGDAQEEMLDLTIVRGFTTASSGGSAITPVPRDPDSAAAAFTARLGDPTVATTGTGLVLWADSMNVRAGMPYILPEQFQPITRNGAGSLVVRMNTAVIDAVTINITAIVQEGL